MPIDKKYIDHFYVKNLTNKTVTIGDLSLLSIPPGKTVDLLTVPRINKEKINQSLDLQTAVRSGFLSILKDNCGSKSRTKDERKATIADENKSLCSLDDIDLSGTQNDDLLVYNSTTGKWENQRPTEIDINLNVVSVSNTYNISISDDLILCDASSSSFSVTLPTAIENSGKQIFVKKIDSSSNSVIVNTVLSQTIDSESNQALTVQGDCVDLASDNENWFIT